MCIYAVATNFHDDFTFLLLFNRDEYYQRPSSPPARRLFFSSLQEKKNKSSVLYGPRDDVSGGTWIGCNIQTGRIVALTNVRAASPSLCCNNNNNKKKKLRGELVVNILCQEEEGNSNHEFDKEYYNYHLLQTNVLMRNNENNKEQPCFLSLELVTCAPPNYKPQKVEYKVKNNTQNDTKPWVAVKSNNHGIGLTTNKDGSFTKRTTTPTREQQQNHSLQKETWPKVVWLCKTVETILVNARKKIGGRPYSSKQHTPQQQRQEEAEALVEQLQVAMDATSMTDDDPVLRSHDEAAAHFFMPSECSPVSTIPQERNLSRAPFIMPFQISDKNGSWYGTVSQCALLYSRSEQCLYFAYRDTKQRIPTKQQEDQDQHLPAWTWERVPISQQQDETKENAEPN